MDLRSKLKTQPYVLLGDVVDFIPEKQNAYGKKITVQKSSIYQYVEIQDIGFGDFHCKEMRGWELPSRAKHFHRLAISILGQFGAVQLSGATFQRELIMSL